MIGDPLLKHLVLVERPRVSSPVVLWRPPFLQPHIIVHEIVFHYRHSHPEEKSSIMYFSVEFTSPCMSSHSLHPQTFGGKTLGNPKVGTKLHTVLLHC